MADDESRGVHLSDKQLVFVFMAGTVVAVVVIVNFAGLLPVLVGLNVTPIVQDAPAARTPGQSSVIA